MKETRGRARIQLIVFRLNQIEFAVPIEQVWRVEPLGDLTVTRVPRAPAFLEGVVNVRGRVIPLLDLKKRFGLAETAPSAKARLLIVEVEEQRVGLIVDTVSDILWFPTTRIEPPPPMLSQISGVFIQGVGKQDDRLLIILSLQEILNPAERQELGEVELPGDETER